MVADSIFLHNGSANRALTPDANLNVTARYANEQCDVGLSDNNQQLIGLGGSLAYQLNDTLDGILTVNFTRQLADAPTNQFSEMVVSVGLQKQF